jgi:hypothetical protein
MLLCKIMSDNADDVPGTIASKSGLKYAGLDLEAMKLVAKARSQASLTQLKVSFLHAFHGSTHFAFTALPWLKQIAVIC